MWSVSSLAALPALCGMDSRTTWPTVLSCPWQPCFEDQLPISENEEIVVEMLPSTTAPTASNIRDKRGVLEWAFEAKAGEVRDISFAWRVRWPKDKGVVMVPAG